MNEKKGFYSSWAFVLLCNLVIFGLVYAILMTETNISIPLIAIVVVALLIMERKGLVNQVFTAYIKNRAVAIISTSVLLIALPFMLAGQRYIAHIAIMVVIHAMVAMGLNFQMGSTDMVNFAPAAFMGMGAYSVAAATVKLGLSPWIGFLLAIVISGLFGILIGVPTLRTKGYYLSLVTMAIQLAFTQLLYNLPSLGGANGIAGVKPFAIGSFEFFKSYTLFGFKMAPQIPYLFFCLLILVILTYIAMRVNITRFGLSLNNIAQDEIAANCLGVNITRQKLFAFVIGGVFCGVSGALYSGLNSYVGPEDFNFAKSLMIICMVILGGMDNSIGVIVGAFLLTVITEKLRKFADFQQLVYGAILVIVLIVRPSGLIPKRVRNYCLLLARQLEIHTKTEFTAGLKVEK